MPTISTPFLYYPNQIPQTYPLSTYLQQALLPRLTLHYPSIPHIPPTPQPSRLPFSKKTRTPEPNPFSRATVMTIEAMSFTLEPLNLRGTELVPGLVSWEDTHCLPRGQKEDRTTNPQILRPTPPKISSPCKIGRVGGSWESAKKTTPAGLEPALPKEQAF